MKKIIVLLFLVFFSSIFAQKSISGKVSDKSGAGLAGVNVKEKGTSKGTLTDFEGNYKISVAENAVLQFSALNFVKVEQAVGQNTTVDVTMLDDEAAILNDVVVVGTRTAPRSNTTSALPVDVLTLFPHLQAPSKTMPCCPS